MADKVPPFTALEIKAGIFVLLSGIVFIVFIAAVLKYRPQGDTKTYYVYASDTGGLGRSAVVRFGGVIVGRITDVSTDPDDQSRIRAKVEVASSTPVNADSKAFVGQTTLTSEKHLEITTGTKDALPLEPLSEIPSTVGGLFGDLSGLSTAVTQLLEDVTLLLGVSDAEGKRTFALDDGGTIIELFSTMEGLLADLRVLIGVVDEQGRPLVVEGRKTFSEVLVNVDDAVVHGGDLLGGLEEILEENRQEINDVLTTAKDVGDSAQEAVDHLDAILTDNRENIDGAIEGARHALESLDSLTAELEKLTVSLQGAIDRNGATLEDMLRDLSDTMRNLKEVTRTLAEQPQAILRGKQPVGRQ